jgi:hypothetical protein
MRCSERCSKHAAMVHSGRPKKLTLNTAFERPVSYDLDITSHWLCAEHHPRTVTLTQWNQFPRVNRRCPGIPHRRFVLRIFPGVFCTCRCVLHQQVCFAPAGVFCTGGVFCTSVLLTHFSGRVLHQQVCFAPAGCFEPACFLRIFPGVFCTDGAFYIFSGRVLHRRGVLRISRNCSRCLRVLRLLPG